MSFNSYANDKKNDQFGVFFGEENDFNNNSNNSSRSTTNTSLKRGASNSSNNVDPLSVISKNLFEFSSNNAKIKQCADTIGTSKDRKETRQQMDQCIIRNNQLVQEIGSDLKKLPSFNGSSNEEKNNKLHKMKLTKDYEESLPNYKFLLNSATSKAESTPLSNSSSNLNSNYSSNAYEEEEDMEKKKKEEINFYKLKLKWK